MNGFDRRRQKKMSAILAAAFELFTKSGIEATRLIDIAEKANVSKVSIYNYFGNKEELARQVIYDYMDKKAVEFKTFMDSDLTFIEKLESFYTMKENSVDELTNSQEDGGLISNELMGSPQVQIFMNTYAEVKIKPLFIKFIEQGKAEGEINRDISTETILMYIQSMHGILSSPITMKQRYELGKLFYHGFKGK